jgi:hypothetical protein
MNTWYLSNSLKGIEFNWALEYDVTMYTCNVTVTCCVSQFNLSVNLAVKINIQVHYTAILSSTYTLHLQLLQSA